MFSGSKVCPAHFTARTVKKAQQHNPFMREVIAGLTAEQKRIPSKYFYDEKGSQLFDEICVLEEYYPTRTEMGIMSQYVDEMVECIGSDAALIEYGSGSSLKTRILLQNHNSLAAYIPIDISKEHLHTSAAQLSEAFPHIEIAPVHADYSTEIVLPEPWRNTGRKVVYFPGSTIGNFTPDEAVDFLRRVRALCNPSGGLLLGVDLKKDVDRLEAAYNDARGVTAAFNLNVLDHINGELGANFAVEDFAHYAFYNEVAGRIEMHLRSEKDQVVTVGSERFSFAAGETIHTENSYKYTLEEVEAIGLKAGLKVQKVWTDDEQLFSVQFLTPC